jgi:hypothetical protein
MNLMEAILGGGGSPVSSMARQFGLGEGDVTKAIQQMIPALTNGVKRNVQKKGGLESLLQALNQGGHDRYLDDAGALLGATEDGLGHILGGKDMSRTLADRTAKKTGISSGILKKMLPLIAALVMGSLKKQGGSSGLLEQLLGGLGGGGGRASAGGLLGRLLGGLLGGRKKRTSSSALDSLTGLLDADGKGSVIDDLLGFAKKAL